MTDWLSVRLQPFFEITPIVLSFRKFLRYIRMQVEAIVVQSKTGSTSNSKNEFLNAKHASLIPFSHAIRADR